MTKLKSIDDTIEILKKSYDEIISHRFFKNDDELNKIIMIISFLQEVRKSYESEKE